LDDLVAILNACEYDNLDFLGILLGSSFPSELLLAGDISFIELF